MSNGVSCELNFIDLVLNSTVMVRVSRFRPGVTDKLFVFIVLDLR